MDDDDIDYGDLTPINPPRRLSAREIAERERLRIKRAQEEAQSRTFNSYMIELFNSRSLN